MNPVGELPSVPEQPPLPSNDPRRAGHTQHQLNSAELEADRQRIGREILGSDSGTDPFVAAVRATRMPMIICNPREPDNPAVFANDAFCRLTGYERDEIRGPQLPLSSGPRY